MKKIVLLTLLFLLALKGFADYFNNNIYNNNEDELTHDDYILKLKDYFNANVAYKVDFMSLKMFDDNNIRRFTYYSNLKGIVSLGARYKIFAMSYSFNMRDLPTYNKNFEQTYFNNFDFGIKTRHFWMILYYYKYKGFYYSEKNVNFPVFSDESAYIQNQDLSTYRFGLKSNIIKNKNYSMLAAFEYTEIQTRSAGSIFFLINTEISNIRSVNTPLIPHVYNPYFTDLTDFKKTTFFSMGVGMGYGYSLVVGPMNFSNAILAAPNIQIYYYESLKLKVPYDAYFRSSISMNFKHFYSGFMVSLDLNSHYFNENIVRKQAVFFTFRLGLRIFD